MRRNTCKPVPDINPESSTQRSITWITIKDGTACAVITCFLSALLGGLARGWDGLLAAATAGIVGGAIFGATSGLVGAMTSASLGRAIGWPVGGTLGMAIALGVYVTILPVQQSLVPVCLVGASIGAICGSISGSVCGAIALKTEWSQLGPSGRRVKLAVIVVVFLLGVVGLMLFIVLSY